MLVCRLMPGSRVLENGRHHQICRGSVVIEELPTNLVTYIQLVIRYGDPWG